MQLSAFHGLGTTVTSMVPLAQWVTLGLGGAAQYYAEPRSIPALAKLVERCRDLDLPCRVLGYGSNVVISSRIVTGLVVRLTAQSFRSIRILGRQVEAGAGAPLGRVITATRVHGLAGLHHFVGIPALVGGAVRCNAGSGGSEIGHRTIRVAVLTQDGRVGWLGQDQLRFGYRKSNLGGSIILRVAFDLDAASPSQITAEMRALLRRRASTQPSRVRSAGCFFKNPLGDHAGRLIEAAGLNDARSGGARVSMRHANFIVADPGATSADVLHLADHVRCTVQSQLGVELELEVEIW